MKNCRDFAGTARDRLVSSTSPLRDRSPPNTPKPACYVTGMQKPVLIVIDMVNDSSTNVTAQSVTAWWMRSMSWLSLCDKHVDRSSGLGKSSSLI
jgi:hypothetical protein